MSRQLKIGVIISGAGGPGRHNQWREPSVAADASVDIRHYIDWAQRAEAALADHVFIVDSVYITPDSPPHYLNRLEPLTLLSAVAVHTTRIGLVGTLTTSYNSPYNLARRFASLDLISGGRAGWNVVATGDGGTARNFGLDEHYDHDTRYARALEHVRLTQRLWDSYEDDAFPRDVETGVFVDPERQHEAEWVGEHFSVAGALNIERSPQGQPVIFQAGDSEQGRDLAGAVAEGVFTHASTVEAGIEFRDDIRARARKAGRDPSRVLIVPGAQIVVRATDEAARQREDEIHARDADFDKSLAQFGRTFGWHDFSQYDLDAPFPDVAHLGAGNWKTRADEISSHASEHDLSLRQTVEHFTKPKRSPFVGSPTTVADELQRWFEAGALDGVNVYVDTADDFAAFADGVLPILRERGITRTAYEGTTLRESLGLDKPENHYTAARRATSAAA